MHDNTVALRLYGRVGFRPSSVGFALRLPWRCAARCPETHPLLIERSRVLSATASVFSAPAVAARGNDAKAIGPFPAIRFEQRPDEVPPWAA
jgi:hypothetical protein